MSDSQILVSRELLRNVKREVDDLRDERDALLDRVAALEAGGAASGDARAQAERAAEQAAQATEEASALRAELADVRSQLALALADAEAARAEADELRRTHPMPPPRGRVAGLAAGLASGLAGRVAGVAERLAGGADPSPGAAPDPARPAAIAGTAFAAWCRRNRALVSRPYLFASFLASAAEGMETEVTPVYRDRTAGEPTFRTEAIDGVEHWLVRVGPETVLLPQPLSATQFRELAPVFTGEATPETVGEVVPAAVRAQGGAHVLVAAGRVTRDDA